jgi:uncharacterized protein (DUF1800 family)
MRMHLRGAALTTCELLLVLSAQALVAQSITISPGYTSIGVGGTVQYSATVTGLTNKAVTWEVSDVVGGNSTNGTITTGGLYKAPAKIPANGVTITALGSDGKTTDTVYVNIAPAGPAITSISPNPIHVGSYNITVTGTGFAKGATVRNTANINLTTTYVNSTTLKASGYQGSTQAGLFQVENPGSLWGPVFSVPFTSGNKTPQTISPTTASVTLGGTQQFTSAGATSWTATAGTITTAGLYTAPSTMPSTKTVTVTATGPNGSASATVTLVSGTPQTISPTTASLNLGATQQFTSAGATSWTASAGTITTGGLYTAPATLPTSSTVTVTATGPNGSASATVTLLAPTPVITGVSGNGQLPLGIFIATITGSGFLSQSVAQINGTALKTSYAAGALSVTGFYGKSGTANLTVSNGTVTSQPFAVQVGVANAKASAAAARRFLEQAAFGPTPTDAAHVQTIGIPAWLTEQFSMAQVSNYNTITSDQGGMPNHFLTMAVTNPDQLRQRVAFALSQIFVTSIDKLIWNGNMVLYQNMLLADSFTNYRQIMADVTLSPAMGQYLDMANNAKADPTTGSLANENYARELMQLFTIGTHLLNQDGTPQLDGNNLPIPTYSQFTITEFARVYTGWTYAPAPGNPVDWGSYISGYGPMVPYEPEHDTGSKQLLNGYVSPAGVSAQQDLNNALDNIFKHPNVGPFVGTQLIQHLVKSNPSPAYVSRVAAAFNNNGSGVRGDMRAVITAVLTDPEARANDEGGNDLPTDGHLQEPGLFLAGMVRAFGGQMNDQNYYASELAAMGQDVFTAPSVFNYYSPNYVIPGTTLTGGEFEIHTPNNAIVRANEVASLFFSGWQNPVLNYGPGTTVDVSAFVPLASNPTTLVNALDLTLTHGVMPAAMKTAIVNAVTADTLGAVNQVQTACYLILTSSYYNVWH